MKSSIVKRIIAVSVIIIAVLFLGEFLHLYLVDKFEWKVDLQIASLYYFFGFGALFTYLLLEVGKSFVPDKIIIIFMVSLMIKLGMFIVLFFGGELEIDTLNMSTRISIVIPLFLFVIIECVLALLVLREDNK